MKHHAYLSIGTSDEEIIRGRVYAQFGKNPDIMIIHESLGVDESRAFREQWGTIARDNLLVVLSFAQATGDAQNTLLKLLEEPPVGITFFVHVPYHDAIIPTLRSRMVVLDDVSGEEVSGTKDVNAFLSGTLAERFKLAERIGKAKDRARAHELLLGIEHALHADMGKYGPIFSELETLRSFARDGSSSPKMLLEHAALLVPLQ